MPKMIHIGIEHRGNDGWEFDPPVHDAAVMLVVARYLCGMDTFFGDRRFPGPRGMPLNPTPDDRQQPGQTSYEVFCARYRTQLADPDERITSWLTLEELNLANWPFFSQTWNETYFSVGIMKLIRDLCDKSRRKAKDFRIVYWFDELPHISDILTIPD